MSVPALRFNEFSSCWIKKKLGEVSTYTKGFAFKSDDYQENGTRIVRVSDLTASAIKQDNQMIFIDSLKAAKYSSYKLNNGDIVITTVGSKPELFESAVGRGILITKNDEGLLNQNLLKLNSSEKMNNSFLFRQINSERYIAHIKNIQRGNANQSNITLKDLFEFDVFIAESKEQTKVANFLTAVDEKITQLTQKRDLLTQYKKGVMQQIFSHSKVRSDCTVSYPRGISRQLRFKDDDGQDFPEWNDLMISELNLYISDGNYGEQYPTSAQMVSSGVPFIRANNIKEQKLVWDDMKFITADHHKILTSGHLLPNDILITTRGEIGIVALVQDEFGGSNINAQICLLRVKETNELAPEYLIQVLTTNHCQKQFKELQTGSALKQLPKSSLGKVSIKLPCLSEQTKIANFLTAIDDKITATQTQLQAVKQYKQGLLQQMFV